jgi:hypothetical protein
MLRWLCNHLAASVAVVDVFLVVLSKQKLYLGSLLYLYLYHCFISHVPKCVYMVLTFSASGKPRSVGHQPHGCAIICNAPRAAVSLGGVV